MDNSRRQHHQHQAQNQKAMPSKKPQESKASYRTIKESHSTGKISREEAAEAVRAVTRVHHRPKRQADQAEAIKNDLERITGSNLPDSIKFAARRQAARLYQALGRVKILKQELEEIKIAFKAQHELYDESIKSREQLTDQLSAKENALIELRVKHTGEAQALGAANATIAANDEGIHENGGNTPEVSTDELLRTYAESARKTEVAFKAEVEKAAKLEKECQELKQAIEYLKEQHARRLDELNEMLGHERKRNVELQESVLNPSRAMEASLSEERARNATLKARCEQLEEAFAMAGGVGRTPEEFVVFIANTCAEHVTTIGTLRETLVWTNEKNRKRIVELEDALNEKGNTITRLAVQANNLEEHLGRERVRNASHESVLRNIVEMPDYDQDNEHRLRHMAKQGLDATIKSKPRQVIAEVHINYDDGGSDVHKVYERENSTPRAEVSVPYRSMYQEMLDIATNQIIREIRKVTVERDERLFQFLLARAALTGYNFLTRDLRLWIGYFHQGEQSADEQQHLANNHDAKSNSTGDPGAFTWDDKQRPYESVGL